MKELLKNLPWMIIGFVGFVIVSIMDMMLLMMAMCVKATRSIIIWFQGLLDPNSEYDDAEAMNNQCSIVVNETYKIYVDKMYPVKGDEEESE